MSRRRWRWFVVIAGLIPATPAQQEPQEPQETVQLTVQVTGVTGRDVYLDKGRTAGVEPGLRVRLFAPGTPGIEAEVRSVSATSARAELPPGVPPPPVGTRGEVLVQRPQEQPKPGPAESPSRRAPEHPPWTREQDPRSPDQPLLVPTFGQKPEERPATLDGRVFASSQWSRDSAGGSTAHYLWARTGLYTEGQNLLGLGERLQFAGEISERRAYLPFQPDTDDFDVRLDLFSLAFGTEHWAPLGAEVGRFLSPAPALPEIGLVDGVETVWRFDEGIRMGVGFGSYPLPYPARDSGEDLGFHAFYEHVADESRSFAFTAGLQKTWHEGTPDRDLLLLRAEGRPFPGAWLFGSAKIDWYTGSDDLKPSGPQITEFLGQARWDGSDGGVGATLSRFRWPELLRQEYQNLPDDLVRDGLVDRLSMSGWIRPSADVRLNARVDLWKDQDTSGSAFELGADWNNAFDTGTMLSAQLFRTDGENQSGPGLRLMARRAFDDVWVNVGYRWYDYEINGLLTGTESYVRQAVELGVSWAIGDFDFDLQAEHWFGDRERAYALGLYAHWRF